MPNFQFRKTLQSLIASSTFPKNRPDWYTENGYGSESMTLQERFEAFLLAQQTPNASLHEAFKSLDFNRRVIPVQLTNTRSCKTEIISVSPQQNQLIREETQPQRHIVYFTGIDSAYQNCYLDIATAVKSTGASVHAFEYPGMQRLGGSVLEVNDLVNTGIAVVNTLLQSGVALDDIVLLGDSFGAAVAFDVKQQFMTQSNVAIRCIMNNTFDTFESAIQAALNKSCFTKPFSRLVGPILDYTGWNSRPGDYYGDDTPYQFHIQHLADLTLPEVGLADRVAANRRMSDFEDPCPAEYHSTRSQYDRLHWVTVTSDAEQRIAERYGRNSYGQIDTHLADLSELVCPSDNSPAYATLVAPYLRDSEVYTQRHPQSIDLRHLPQALESEVQSFVSLIPCVAFCRSFFFSGSTNVRIESNNEETLRLL